MADNYVTAVELKATLELVGQDYADPDLTLAIGAASRAVEGATGRRFWLDDDATSVRYYTPSDAGRLQIDDLVELTSVKTDADNTGGFESVWEQTDYVLLPLNAAADGWPYTAIARRPGGTFRFPADYMRSVEVTGQFGWPAVPDEVKAATVILATKLLRRVREAPFGVVGFGVDGGAVRIARTDPDVKDLLSPYTRSQVGSVKLG